MATRDAATANRAAAAKRSAHDKRAARSRGRLPIIIVAVVVVCAAVAIGVTVAVDGGSSGGDAVVENRAVDVSVSGQPLPAYVEGTIDSAEGQAFPTMTGTGIDGEDVTIDGGDGPMLVVYLAHWCPVCQSEVPVIRDWAAQGGADGVEVRGISTSFARERGNWPSSDWLRGEGWDFPTLLDPDESASRASGQSRFPFFVAVDGNGDVVARLEGALQPAQLDALVAAVR